MFERDQRKQLWMEWVLLAAIFCLAGFFRTCHLDRFPCGLCLDQAVPALGGLLVRDGWRPFFETSLLDCPSLPLYPAALWFKFFAPTALNAALLTVTYSLLSLGLTYFFFRQLAGAGPALFAAFLGAVSHWDAYLCRWAGIDQLPFFFVYGSLLLLVYGVKSGKHWPFWAAGLWGGLGFYGYYSYRVFPIIVVAVFLYEVTRSRVALRQQRTKWLAFSLMFLATLAPLIWHWSQEPHFGQGYPAAQFIGQKIVETKSVMPLAENTVRFLGLFGVQGDPSPKQTTGQAPMLDLVTYLLAVFGFGWALWNWRQRAFFYSLAVFFAFSLTDILSTDPTNISHAFPLLPCVLFWAGHVLWWLSQERGERYWRYGLPVLCFALAAGLNAYQLFQVQEKDKHQAMVFDLAPTLAGKEVARLGSRYEMVICPSLDPHLTVRFLGYDHQKDHHGWNWPMDLAFAQVPAGKEGVCFILTRGQSGILDLLKGSYPNASVLELNDPQGVPLIHEVLVPAATLQASRGMKWTLPRTKKGTAVGMACVFIPLTGEYQFVSQGAKKTVWEVDGKKLKAKKGILLARGFHSLKVKLTAVDPIGPQLSCMGPDGKTRSLNDQDLTQLPLDHGLLAQYGDPAKPVLEEWDPVVNFVSKAEFGSTSSPQVHWGGQVFVPVAGNYSFLALTQSTDKAQLLLDQKPLGGWTASPSGTLLLKKGWHRLDVTYQMGDDLFSAMNLAWKGPLDSNYRPIPPMAFGPVTSELP